MPVVQGDLLVIEVEDTTPTPAVWVPVNDMNRFSRRTSRSTNKTRVFMRSAAYTSRSQREITATISGFVNTNDPGQALVRAAMAADTQVKLKIMPDGTNGFSQPFYVSNQSADATPDPENFQECGWELTDAAAPVIVGLGPIL